MVAFRDLWDRHVAIPFEKGTTCGSAFPRQAQASLVSSCKREKTRGSRLVSQTSQDFVLFLPPHPPICLIQREKEDKVVGVPEGIFCCSFLLELYHRSVMVPYRSEDWSSETAVGRTTVVTNTAVIIVGRKRR